MNFLNKSYISLVGQGMGLSRTSPSQMETQNINNWVESNPSDHNIAGLFHMTSALDATPIRNRQHLSKCNQVEALLTNLQLGHYIHNFVDAEIDMTVFLTLTEQDLINLDIRALGARRRILLAIRDMTTSIQQEFMQQNTTPSPAQNGTPPTPLRGLRFNGSAAPGDERLHDMGRSANGN